MPLGTIVTAKGERLHESRAVAVSGAFVTIAHRGGLIKAPLEILNAEQLRGLAEVSKRIDEDRKKLEDLEAVIRTMKLVEVRRSEGHSGMYWSYTIRCARTAKLESEVMFSAYVSGDESVRVFTVSIAELVDLMDIFEKFDEWNETSDTERIENASRILGKIRSRDLLFLRVKGASRLITPDDYFYPVDISAFQRMLAGGFEAAFREFIDKQKQADQVRLLK